MAGAALVAWGRWWTIPWGVLSLALAVFSLFFFRDLDRDTPQDDFAIYSPGDGKVVDVSTLSEGPHMGKRIIRIFLSVFDGHLQRSPAKGTVTRLEYKEGLFLDARHPEAHVRNEQNILTLQTAKGALVVVQIAGLIARRIVCWVKEGTSLGQGERYGLIRFGSQVDVIMPAATTPTVKVGDRVTAGETVIARWNS